MTGPVVATESGLLEGRSDPSDQVRSFLGVPYAAPPLGDLRWRAPQRPASWTGTRAATRYAPSARQPLMTNSLYYGGETEFSEDCLYLNIWTGPDEVPEPPTPDASNAAPSSGRPVLVWFHFGAFQFGSGANPLYEGTELARAGATVVTVNYRLGRFGFLAHPWLTAESEHHSSGNYGMLDQIEALRWVQRNIAAFGGDPGNVTICGLSAGGHTVHNLRASRLADGLYHRAIAQSGPGVAPAIDGPGHPAAPQTLAAGEAAGQEVTDLLGVGSLAELRALPAEAIDQTPLPRAFGVWQFDLLPTDGISLQGFDSGYPVVDGHVLPESPLTAYESGRAHDVPMLVGNAGNEGSGLPYLATLADYRTYVASEYGELADRVLKLYPAEDDASAMTASRELEGDRIFVWSSWTAARLQARTGRQPVRYYRILHAPPIPPTSDLAERDYAGAFHGAELTYMFGTYSAWDWPWTDADRALGEHLSATWLAFARTGDPNLPARPAWPVFDEDAPTTMLWQAPEGVVGDAVRRDRMELLDRFNALLSPAGQR